MVPMQECLEMMIIRVPERPNTLMTVTPKGFPRQRKAQSEAPQIMIARMFVLRGESGNEESPGDKNPNSMGPRLWSNGVVIRHCHTALYNGVV